MTNELYHYGVLGMKWGVRRSRKSVSSKKTKNVGHEDYKKAHSSKNVNQMSDAELRCRLNRLQMEQQYSNLSAGTVNKGKQYFNKVMKAATTVAAITTTGLTIYNNVDKIRKIIGK